MVNTLHPQNRSACPSGASPRGIMLPEHTKNISISSKREKEREEGISRAIPRLAEWLLWAATATLKP
ncbi:hypothetical protein N7465_001229 [Penicillium sp. CMV-2018d]|nr:hypothetical protein N7465_001229 [Penicillium sp. CMV-2018d]